MFGKRKYLKEEAANEAKKAKDKERGKRRIPLNSRNMERWEAARGDMTNDTFAKLLLDM
jgi:hypothetical protein